MHNGFHASCVESVLVMTSATSGHGSGGARVVLTKVRLITSYVHCRRAATDSLAHIAMRISSKLLAVATALLMSGAALGAQRPLRYLGHSRPDSSRREAAKQRRSALTGEQRAAIRERAKAARAERQQLSQRVKSGQITRRQARVQMRAWQKSNRTQAPRSGTVKPESR